LNDGFGCLKSESPAVIICHRVGAVHRPMTGCGAPLDVIMLWTVHFGRPRQQQLDHRLLAVLTPMPYFRRRRCAKAAFKAGPGIPAPKPRTRQLLHQSRLEELRSISRASRWQRKQAS
jgi:hypothetical protein